MAIGDRSIHQSPERQRPVEARELDRFRHSEIGNPAGWGRPDNDLAPAEFHPGIVKIRPIEQWRTAVENGDRRHVRPAHDVPTGVLDAFTRCITDP
jgi:hypothetical protein